MAGLRSMGRLRSPEVVVLAVRAWPYPRVVAHSPLCLCRSTLEAVALLEILLSTHNRLSEDHTRLAGRADLLVAVHSLPALSLAFRTSFAIRANLASPDV